jgi:hypothetical protein
MPLSPGDGGRKVHHIQLPPTIAAERAGVLRGTGSFSLEFYETDQPKEEEEFDVRAHPCRGRHRAARDRAL